MSNIKNGGLDKCGSAPFEQQQFGTAGVEGLMQKINSRQMSEIVASLNYRVFMIIEIAVNVLFKILAWRVNVNYRLSNKFVAC